MLLVEPAWAASLSSMSQLDPPRRGSRPPRVEWRFAVAASLVSLWLTMLLIGWVLAGTTHLLLVASVIVFPWRAVSRQLAVPVPVAEELWNEPKDFLDGEDRPSLAGRGPTGDVLGAPGAVEPE